MASFEPGRSRSDPGRTTYLDVHLINVTLTFYWTDIFRQSYLILKKLLSFFNSCECLTFQISENFLI